MSTPAANAFSLPVMTMQPIAGIGLEAVERAVDLADQLGVERVQRMRAVERDDPDLALGRDEDRFIGAVRFSAPPVRFRGGEDIQEHDGFSPLVLTGWTIESRPSSLDDAAYGSSAAFSRARFALASVDLEAVLKLAERAVGALVVAKRRAAGFDRVLEHRLDAIDERFRLRRRLAGLGGERAGEPSAARCARGTAPRRHRCCRAPRSASDRSSAALIEVALPLSLAASHSGVKLEPSGSTPRPLNRAWLASASAGTRSISPKRRASE